MVAYDDAFFPDTDPLGSRYFPSNSALYRGDGLYGTRRSG